MLWRGGRRSDNVEDRRGSGGGGGFGGGGIGMPHIGIGGLVVILIVGWLFGVNPLTLLDQMSGGDAGYQQDQGGDQTASRAGDDEMKQFVSAVLADTEDVWTAEFRQMGKTYQDPRLVLFSGRVASACGLAQSAMGPFYCPGDSKVYIDLSFYDELRQRFQAPGDFAEAYVIAHEVGHHVQHLLGITDQVDKLQARMSESEANALSVRVDLKVVEPGDVDEALTAASAIGDDRLQQESQGYVVPDSFTHGTSAQRMRWFNAGMRNGDINDCDTFNAKQL